MVHSTALDAWKEKSLAAKWEKQQEENAIPQTTITYTAEMKMSDENKQAMADEKARASTFVLITLEADRRVQKGVKVGMMKQTQVEITGGLIAGDVVVSGVRVPSFVTRFLTADKWP